MRLRILGPGEWGQLPLNLAPLFEHIDKSGAGVVLVEDGQEVVACAALLNLPHLEGAWVAPSRRKNPGVGRMLLRGILQLLTEKTTGWVLSSSDDPTVLKLFERLGGIPLPVSPDTKGYALDVSNREAMRWPLRRRLEEEVWVG